MDLQETLNKAWELKKTGDRTGALKLYDEAFNTLASEATAYAHKQTRVSPLSNKVTPDIFAESKSYFKQNNVACTISNNMATIFAELGDYESAKKLFVQAIELTPEGVDYSDPKIGLQELNK